MRRIAMILLAAVSLAACGTDAETPRARSSDPTTTTTTRTVPSTPEAKWKAAGITHYRFDYSAECFCFFGPDPVTIEVRDGVVVGDKPAGDLRTYPTIDELIADAMRAEAEATGDVTVTYDETLGIPTKADIDWVKNAVDDEIAWTITNFEPLP